MRTLTAQERIEFSRMVCAWKKVDMTPFERGASCPCGFKGGPRNIRNHKNGCDVWKFYETCVVDKLPAEPDAPPMPPEPSPAEPDEYACPSGQSDLCEVVGVLREAQSALAEMNADRHYGLIDRIQAILDENKDAVVAVELLQFCRDRGLTHDDVARISAIVQQEI